MRKSRNPVRNLQRYWRVQSTFLRYGFDFLVAQDELEQLRAFLVTHLGHQPPEFADRSLPERVRLLLQELGPTYVKLGQVVSSQSYILPQTWLDELKKLQNEVAPIPVEQVREVITQELGRLPRS